jgi:hypothetical protein
MLPCRAMMPQQVLVRGRQTEPTNRLDKQNTSGGANKPSWQGSLTLDPFKPEVPSSVRGSLLLPPLVLPLPPLLLPPLLLPLPPLLLRSLLLLPPLLLPSLLPLLLLALLHCSFFHCSLLRKGDTSTRCTCNAGNTQIISTAKPATRLHWTTPDCIG